MKKRVAIVFGGNSVEHEISILSMIQVNNAISRKDYEVVLVYLTKEGQYWVGPGFDSLQTFQKFKFKHYNVVFYRYRQKVFLKGIKCLLPFKYRHAIDVVLPVVHGKNVEDGSLAGYFNILDIAYASSPVLLAAVLQNKYYTKLFLRNFNVNIVPYIYSNLREYKEDVFLVIEKSKNLGYPLIIKPVSLGSSIGIKTLNNQEDLIKAINYATKFENEFIIEKKLLSFRELNQAILKHKEDYFLSSIEEVFVVDKYFSFDDKYINQTTKREIPAKLSEDLKERVNNCSKEIIDIFKPKGVIRVDYLYDDIEDKIYVNEINSIPGSLSFYLFEGQLSFSFLIDKLINDSLREKYNKGLKLTSFKSNVLFSKNIMKK